ncbi:hypothetical protein NEHOM01_1672 [Nematocida homosporus]|uniref:uncharacterized protein n=1 Tax=Nematocida homosporus TaxID=1912981 RepID=UPI00221F9D02|nr:uncharacterized protein NEHOM01_1672 [Nematocida homosporus]KAI5186741.1 hypothetical protein NEHOM01_1672 [Nematocida homosporus]
MDPNNVRIPAHQEAICGLHVIIQRAADLLHLPDQAETFLAENRRQASELGHQLAVAVGYQAHSEEARRLGCLLAGNMLISPAETIQFLINAQVSPPNHLRRQIAIFVQQTHARLVQDRKKLLQHIADERNVLEKIKTSDKGAKNDPKWCHEITQLDEQMQRMHNRLVGAQITTQTEQLQRHQRYRCLLHILAQAATIRCYCNFQAGLRVSKHALLRELALQSLETREICFLKALLRFCPSTSTQTSICSTSDRVGLSRYAAKTNEIIRRLHPAHSGPWSNQPSKKTNEIPTNDRQLCNLYLEGQRRVNAAIAAHCQQTNQSIEAALSEAIAIHFRQLFKNQKGVSDAVVAARISTDGVFAKEGLLGGYFAKYHQQRVVELCCTEQALVKKLVQTATERSLHRSTGLLEGFVRRRLHSLIRIETLRYLSGRPSVSVRDLSRRGLFGHALGVRAFLESARPLIAFGVLILQSLPR